ncbi:MAG: glucose-1-phosphate adenylyltransferase [Acidobacteria bacterium]|nr:glucose-1-phosphate adenylyltransferase [Acidobacteriota bacterium]
MQDVLTILLAGGAGERLWPLTRERAKPAVPFGGIYRIIDVTLSNCINSGLRKVYILTQYKALSLNRHLRRGWNILSPELGEFIETLPPMKRVSENWYLGTADAVYQNLSSILEEATPYTLILSGDHVYKMNYAQMVALHQECRADVTLATIQIHPSEASRFGVTSIDEDGRVVDFEEKPQHRMPAPSRFNPSMCSASMGVYLFSTEVLAEALRRDAEDAASDHDFGRDILPGLAREARVVAYDFIDENKKEVLYWRDIGTLDTYYEANMDLVSVHPVFNLYDAEWPIRTHMVQYPPAKFVFADEGRRMGVAVDSVVSHGCIISGGRVLHSILSPGVRVNSYCEVEHSILMPHVVVGRHSRIRRAIIDRQVEIPERTEIGFDPEQDRANGYVVTEEGIVVVDREIMGQRPVPEPEAELA